MPKLKVSLNRRGFCDLGASHYRPCEALSQYDSEGTEQAGSHLLRCLFTFAPSFYEAGSRRRMGGLGQGPIP
jgi:hypothetical protein